MKKFLKKIYILLFSSVLVLSVFSINASAFTFTTPNGKKVESVKTVENKVVNKVVNKEVQKNTREKDFDVMIGNLLKQKNNKYTNIAKKHFTNKYNVLNQENGFIVYKKNAKKIEDFSLTFSTEKKQSIYFVNDLNEVTNLYTLIKKVEPSFPLTSKQFNEYYKKSVKQFNIHDKKSNVSFHNNGDDFHVTWYKK